MEPNKKQDDIKVASALVNVGGLLATLGRSQEALPLFTRAHDIYTSHLGAQHPHAVAAQLWIQQLSAPQPAPRVRRRSPPPALSALSGGARQAGHPPPLLEESTEESSRDEGIMSAATVGVTPDTMPPAPIVSTVLPQPPSAEEEKS